MEFDERHGELNGKVVVITGAASGIGRSSAELMAARGASVVVADIDAVGAADVADHIVAGGGEACAVQVDVSEPEAVEAMVRQTVDRYGRLDVLFNNAAILTPEFRRGDTDVVDMDLAVWERTMQVNLRGPMLGCKYAIPEMLKLGRGSIIMTSSAAATAADFVRCAYGVSKGGLNSLVRYVATAFGKDGIRCNAISPGVVLTTAARALNTSDTLERLTEHHVTPRLGEPDDVATLASFLASDQSEFITGAVIPVDGGLSVHLPTYASALHQRSLAQSS